MHPQGSKNYTHTCILLRMEGLKMYMPALILLDTNTFGFSTNLLIIPVSSLYTTTPYLDGSFTRVTYTNKISQYLCIDICTGYNTSCFRRLNFTYKTIVNLQIMFFLSYRSNYYLHTPGKINYRVQDSTWPPVRFSEMTTQMSACVALLAGQ